jgi:hypothetical protein
LYKTHLEGQRTVMAAKHQRQYESVGLRPGSNRFGIDDNWMRILSKRFLIHNDFTMAKESSSMQVFLSFTLTSSLNFCFPRSQTFHHIFDCPRYANSARYIALLRYAEHSAKRPAISSILLSSIINLRSVNAIPLLPLPHSISFRVPPSQSKLVVPVLETYSAISHDIHSHVITRITHSRVCK